MELGTCGGMQPSAMTQTSVLVWNDQRLVPRVERRLLDPSDDVDQPVGQSVCPDRARTCFRSTRVGSALSRGRGPAPTGPAAARPPRG